MKRALAAVNIILMIALCVFIFRGAHGKKSSFSDISVIFLCVGFDEDQHMIEWRKGLNSAEADFGCSIKVWNCGWDESSILDAFSLAINSKTDVICVPGYENESNFKPLMEEALGKGIHVTVYHTPLPELQRQHQADGVGFVGQDEYIDGRKLAVRAIQKFGLDANSEVLVFGNSRPNADLRLRSHGIVGVLKEHGIKNTLIDMNNYWGKLPFRTLEQAFSDYLAEHQMPTCILHDAGGIENLTRAFEAEGIGPGEIKVGAFDSTQGGLTALKKDYVQLINGRNGIQTGYLAVMQGCMSAKYDSYGMDIVIPSVFYDSTNIESFEKLFDTEG